MDDCGPEVLSTRRVEKVLKIQDLDKIEQFLNFKWTLWVPTASWCLKINHVFNLDFVAHTRKDMPVLGTAYNVKLRLGHRWIGPDLQRTTTDNAWLHRIDYDASECALYDAVTKEWDDFEASLPTVVETKEKKSEPKALLELRLMMAEDHPKYRARHAALQRKASSTTILEYQKELQRMQKEDVYVLQRHEQEMHWMSGEDPKFRCWNENRQMGQEDRLVRRRSIEIHTMTLNDVNTT